MRQHADPTVTPLAEIRVVGALDIGSVTRIHTEFGRAVASAPERVVVDLAECDFIDAAGVGLLVAMHQQVSSTGGRLTLRGGSNRLLRTMQTAAVHWQLQHTSDSSAVSGGMQTW